MTEEKSEKKHTVIPTGPTFVFTDQSVNDSWLPIYDHSSGHRNHKNNKKVVSAKQKARRKKK